MSITLFGHPVSNNTRKVEWTLHEAGLAFDRVEVDLMTGEQKKPHIVALNPNGRVPILKHDDVVLLETQAILLHLAETSGKLLPTDKNERAHAIQWLFWVTSDLQMQVQHPWYNKLMAQFGKPLDVAAHSAQVEAAAGPLRVLDAALQGRTWLVGSSLSIADIAACEPLLLCDLAGIDLQPYANIRRWRDALMARPAFAATHKAP